MLTPEQQKKLNIIIPDHKDDLKQLRLELDYIDNMVHELKYNKSINNDIYNYINNQIISILYKIGKLSLSIYKLKKDIEDFYKPKQIDYKNKKNNLVWYNYYLQLNKPYDQLKTKCYKQIKNITLLKQNKSKSVKTLKPKKLKQNKSISISYNVHI